MSEIEEEQEPVQVKIPDEVRTLSAMDLIIDHGFKQVNIIRGMLTQADTGIERAMSAPNDGPGSILKMVIPILVGRRKYLRTEIEMWKVTLDMLIEDRESLSSIIERNGLNAREEAQVASEEEATEKDPTPEDAV